jgi:hypothetical protein
MRVRASGHSALILAIATGVLVCCLGPSLAEDPSDTSVSSVPESAQSAVSPSQVAVVPNTAPAHDLKTSAHAKSSKVALKSPLGKKALSTNGGNSSAIPPSVANANAELTPTLPVGGATGSAVRDNQGATQPTADQVVPPDQLNDLDRAMQLGSSAATPMMAVTDVPAMSTQPSAPGDNDAASGDRTSLIGKIFIGIGVVLTLGSAVRMFVA